MDFLLKEMSDPDVDETIELAIDGVCKFFPVEDCRDTLTKYLTILKVFSGKMDGKTLCTEAGVC